MLANIPGFVNELAGVMVYSIHAESTLAISTVIIGPCCIGRELGTILSIGILYSKFEIGVCL